MRLTIKEKRLIANAVRGLDIEGFEGIATEEEMNKLNKKLMEWL